MREASPDFARPDMRRLPADSRLNENRNTSLSVFT